MLALLALAASLARLRLAPRRSLTARLMFRGRRGRRLIGPHLLLAATALFARTRRALVTSRRHGAPLLPWHGGLLLGTLALAGNGALRWRWSRRPPG